MSKKYTTIGTALTIGVDIAKNSFHLYGVDNDTGELVDLSLKRDQFMDFVAKHPDSRIAMEACGGAQFWGRTFTEMGCKVELLPPKAVKPFVPGTKSDRNDAMGIYRALLEGGGHIKRVPIKSLPVQDQSTILTMRAHLRKRQTADINHVRGILMEYGPIMKKTVNAFLREIDDRLEKAPIGEVVRKWLTSLVEEIRLHEKQIMEMQSDINEIVKKDPMSNRFTAMRGVGPVTSLEVSVLLTKPELFKNGRSFAAFIGTTPGHTGTGGKTKNLGITKRGNRDVRSNLYLCACAIGRSKNKTAWEKKMFDTKPWKVACIAVASKMARQMWAMAMKQEDFRMCPTTSSSDVKEPATVY